jgi:hypothetical protein
MGQGRSLKAEAVRVIEPGLKDADGVGIKDVNDLVRCRGALELDEVRAAARAWDF